MAAWVEDLSLEKLAERHARHSLHDKRRDFVPGIAVFKAVLWREDQLTHVS
jgi:hypothetical protein